MLLDKGSGGKQWCSPRISWVHILWCIMGSDVVLENNHQKKTLYFLREYIVANFLF
jgi:hypothetical protein